MARTNLHILKRLFQLKGMDTKDKPRFRTAKNLYFNGLKLPGIDNGDIPQPDPNSKYARAARLGLCFKCFREDTNPNHRPRHVAYPYCPECYANFHVGVERLEKKNWLEVNKWFVD